MAMTASSEQNGDPLVKYLSALRNEVRIAIMKDLSFHAGPREYSEIQHEMGKTFGNSLNLSYHLNILKDNQMIIGDADGYQLTEIGEKSYIFIESMGGLLRNDPQIVIRTSKYSVELFDESIIEQNLQLEANMPPQKAKKIANEAKKRLKKAKVTYLTAPLVREYINAILIENHYEDFRAKLTRLGLPPYDVGQMLNHQVCDDPRAFTQLLGKNIAEQYVLLNILHQKYADRILSGQVLLADLAHFGTAPLEIVVNGDTLAESLLHCFQEGGTGGPATEPISIDELNSIFELPFFQFLEVYRLLVQKMMPFFPHGLTVLRFDLFLERFLHAYTPSDLAQFVNISSEFLAAGWAITFGVSLIANYVELEPLFAIYHSDRGEKSYAPGKHQRMLPRLNLHLTKNERTTLAEAQAFEDLTPFLQQLVLAACHPSVAIDQFTKWGWPQAEHVFSNLEIPIGVQHVENLQAGVILEKLSLNLLALFKQAQEDEDKFFKTLETAIIRAFDYFEMKASVMAETLPHFAGWADIAHLLLHDCPPTSLFRPMGPTINPPEKLIDSRPDGGGPSPSLQIPIIGAISFHGLEELVFAKTQLYIRMQENNRQYAVKVLDFMQKLLDKQNLAPTNPIKYILAEPHPQEELNTQSHQFLQSVHALSTKLFGEPNEHYRLSFLESVQPVMLTTAIQTFKDLVKSDFRELTLQYHLPEGTPRPSEDELFRIIQELLQTGACRIAYSDI